MKSGSGQACCYCGRKMTRKEKYRNKENFATKDHIIPRAHNGQAIVRCCLGCNRDKGHLLINEYRAVLMVRRRRIVVFYFERCMLKTITRSIFCVLSQLALSL